MVCLGFGPAAARWKAQTNPLSYGSIPFLMPNLFDNILVDFWQYKGILKYCQDKSAQF